VARMKRTRSKNDSSCFEQTFAARSVALLPSWRIFTACHTSSICTTSFFTPGLCTRLSYNCKSCIGKSCVASLFAFRDTMWISAVKRWVHCIFRSNADSCRILRRTMAALRVLASRFLPLTGRSTEQCLCACRKTATHFIWYVGMYFWTMVAWRPVFGVPTRVHRTTQRPPYPRPSWNAFGGTN
jgi:hypothetical protein